MLLSREKLDEFFQILEACEEQIIRNREDQTTDEFAKRYVNIRIEYRPLPDQENTWDAELSASTKLPPSRLPLDLRQEGQKFVSVNS